MTGPTPLTPWQLYRRLVGYASPYWRAFVAGLVGMTVFASTEVAVVRLIKPLTDGGFIQHNPEVIRTMPWLILGVFLIRGAAGFIAAYGIAYVGQRIVARLRSEIFEHLLGVPVAHHDQARSTDLLTKLTYHASVVSDSTTGTLTTVIKDGLTIIGLIGAMLYTSWRLTLFVLLIAPLVAWAFKYINDRFRTISGRIQRSIGGLTHQADEAIAGRRMIKVYGGERFASDNFHQSNDYLRRQNLKLTATNALANSTLELIAAVGVSVLVFLATQPAMLKVMTPGTFVSFIAAMLALRAPLNAFSNLSQKLQAGVAAGIDLFSFLDTQREPDSGQRPLARAQGHIEFENVRFHYRDDTQPALDGLTATIPAGKRTALVGRSGSGKSTLLSLIPRFYDPESGVVRLDGHDLREYRLRELRRQIALVDQNIVLFNASIAENIAYGIEPLPTEAQIVEVAKAANAWVFIEKLPQGIHTPVGQNGVLFSGGERQRISIARALLKDAPILLLDEATSALDSESERLIQDALDRLVMGRTTLVIAHRLSTVKTADQILVMQDGRVVEQGRHDELLAATAPSPRCTACSSRTRRSPPSHEAAGRPGPHLVRTPSAARAPAPARAALCPHRRRPRRAPAGARGVAAGAGGGDRQHRRRRNRQDAADAGAGRPAARTRPPSGRRLARLRRSRAVPDRGVGGHAGRALR
jgi:lipid A export permease/ATP-binding protein MsbA